VFRAAGSSAVGGTGAAGIGTVTLLRRRSCADWCVTTPYVPRSWLGPAAAPASGDGEAGVS
jgi:hypothetical protein